MRRAWVKLSIGLLLLCAGGCACFREDAPARSRPGPLSGANAGCVLDWHRSPARGLRISHRPGAAPFAEVVKSWPQRRVVLPLGPASRGARLSLRYGGVELSGWVPPGVPVLVYPRQPLRLSGPLWLRRGALRWEATQSGQGLRLRAMLPPELRLAGGQLPETHLGCSQVAAQADFYRRADERRLLGLTGHRAQVRVTAETMTFSSRPGGPVEVTVDLRRELRRGVELLARQGAHARVLLSRRRYFLLGWVPASSLSSQAPGLHWIRRRRRYRFGGSPYLGFFRRERWRCAEALTLQLRRAERIEPVGRTIPRHALVVTAGRGLWRSVSPTLGWLRMLGGAEIVVSRAALSGCERR